MGRHWSLKCPNCNSEIVSGWGYGDSVPKIFVPFIRCKYCGKLFKLGGREYITIPVDERIKFSATVKNCEYIEKSLDRTNSREYLTFLQNNGYEIYPITDKDKYCFAKVDFLKYHKAFPSSDAIQSLHNVGILIEEDKLDKESGGFKKEILENNQASYKTNKKANGWGSLVGIIVGIIFCTIFGEISPNSYLFLLGIVFGFLAYFVTFMTISHFNTSRKKSDIRCVENNKELATDKRDDFNSKQQSISCLKKLYNDGVISEEEYKEKIIKIVEKDI